MKGLNYHHLRYFHAIVREGSLTAAAAHLEVSQSSISVQLRKLEEQLGFPLFDRRQKSLQLTEEGGMVYDYATTIFRMGDELVATLHNRGPRYSEVLKVGAVATLSRNFQLAFLYEAIRNESLEVIIRSASLDELLEDLQTHRLDLVLANRPSAHEAGSPLRSYLVDEQPVSLIGPSRYLRRRAFRFPDDLHNVPLVLPNEASDLRLHFDRLMEHTGVRPLVAAEADDMAMLRLLARDMDAMALLPPVVVRDELQSGLLFELHRIPQLRERFYAITAARRYPNPHLASLLSAASASMPASPETGSGSS